jgi:hypothetical protein
LLSAATAVLTVIAVVMVVTSGGSGAGTAYSPAVAQQFTAGCEAHSPASWSQSTASSYCAAALSCVQAHVSYAQLVAINQSVLAGRGDPDAAQLDLCAASALRSTPGTGGSGAAPSSAAIADENAKEVARTAEATMDVIGTDNGGSFLEANGEPSMVSSYEPTIPTAPGNGSPYLSAVTGSASSFSVTVTSTSGDRFTVNSSNGLITRTCTPPHGTHGACLNGTW